MSTDGSNAIHQGEFPYLVSSLSPFMIYDGFQEEVSTYRITG